MGNLLYTLLAFLVVLGILIVVHELGHLVVARLCGVKVLRFSVGFGKPLWSRKFGADQTEWAIAVFPLGGYVKMLDEREGEVAEEERHRAYNRKSVGRRSAIVAAGPLANFVLAFLIYWGIFWVGSQELLPVLGVPPANSPAAAAGIANGDRVRALDGEKVETWQDFRWLILRKAASQEDTELEIINPQQQISFLRLPLAAVRAQGWEGDGFGRLGLRPRTVLAIAEVVAGGAGDRAGLKQGDRLLAIDGERCDTSSGFVEKIKGSAEKKLTITLLRHRERLDIQVQPDAFEDRGGRIGKLNIAVGEYAQIGAEDKAVVRYDFFTAGHKALRETWDKSVFTLVMMGKMLTGEVSWRNLSGPVTIADYAGQSAKLGAEYYLKFMALVSVSLAVLNLLPIPVLDGGHLLYHVAEVVKRGPLSERFMEMGQRVGLAILLVLMAFAFFNDINRLLSG
ncbi:MAG: Regulator of sigma-E protease RseP [Betaproteobacteria bacterium ADurb.Bin341]|nr:MAG: Regulator of sigma-E protease RseP [Betaproteobacteria bacterium ADurb.Bin341]